MVGATGAAGSAVRTVGHGTLPADGLLDVLRAGDVATVVDVRRFPGSRRHPWFGRDAMARWLPEAGVGYCWLPELGGRRAVQADSPHTALRNASLRAYADHMGSAEFAKGLDRLLDAPAPVAVLCSETLWWRCHRRLVADALVVLRGLPVLHLMPAARPAPHVPTDGVRAAGSALIYDAPGRAAGQVPDRPLW